MSYKHMSETGIISIAASSSFSLKRIALTPLVALPRARNCVIRRHRNFNTSIVLFQQENTSNTSSL